MMKRIVSFLMVVVLLCTSVPASAYAIEETMAAPENIVLEEEEIRQITIPENQTAVLDSNLVDQDVTWQFRLGDMWVDIYGITDTTCRLNYAMAKNMLNDQGQCMIQCLDQDKNIVCTYHVQFVSPEISLEEFTPVFNVVNELYVKAAETVPSPETTAAETIVPETSIPETTVAETVSSPETTDSSSAEESSLAEETNSPEESSPAEETSSSEESSPVEETDSSEESSPVEETNSSEESSLVEETDSLEESSPVEETDSLEESSPIVETYAAEESSPVRETYAAEESSPIEETYAVEESSPVEEIPVDTSGVRSNNRNNPDVRKKASVFNLVGDPAEPVLNVPYQVTIQYRSEDNAHVLAPWHKVLKDTGDNQTVYFPEIQGYSPYINCTWDEATRTWTGGTMATEMELDYNTFTEDPNYEVIYKPAEVSYMVYRHYQNATDDEYRTESEIHYGYTGDAIDMEALAGTKDGFYAMWFDTPHILASGSTTVDIYYDRFYYLIKFNLNGGYGTEPIYARFESPIFVPDPKKHGFEFEGWVSVTELPNETIVDLPDVMPRYSKQENREENATIPAQYIAKWKPLETAKVNVVIWGEKADYTDNKNKYDYITSISLQDQVVGQKADTSNLEIMQYICGKEETHPGTPHTEYCYRLKNEPYKLGWFNNFPQNPNDGDLYSKGKKYYVYHVKGNPPAGNPDPNPTGWYEYDHLMNESNRKCHVHDSSCLGMGPVMDLTLWELKSNPDDNPVTQSDGSTVINLYYDRKIFTLNFRKPNSNTNDYGEITERWGKNIADQFRTMGSKDKITMWSEKESGGQPWTSDIQVMPQRNITFYARMEGGKEQVATYYGLKLGGNPDDTGDYTEILLKSTVYDDGILQVSEEDFREFKGFTLNANLSTTVESKFNGAEFYYTRNNYNLDFISGNKIVETVQVPYGAVLDSYRLDKSVMDTTPEYYPEGFEKNAYQFGYDPDDLSNENITEKPDVRSGWYLEPKCAKGTGLDWDGTMHAGNLSVYAKWVPVKHTVRTFTTEQDMENFLNGIDSPGQPLQTLTPLHGNLAGIDVYPDRTSEKLSFVSWFYRDEYGAEVAFDNQNMPVTRDLNLYAKWTSKIMVPFKIYYELANGTEIAPPLEGKNAAGVTKTFYPKYNLELYEAYRSGYFPVVSDCKLTMGTNPMEITEFHFVYQEATVPIGYTVRYLDRATGKPLHDDVIKYTSLPVIYEDFLPIEHYVPDAYSKKLYISALEGTNVITFWYTWDESHARMRKTHWIERLEPVTFPPGEGTNPPQYEENYEIYSTETALLGDLGTVMTIESLHIPGFKEVPNPEGTFNSGTLTMAGLHLMRFYDRIDYPYEIRYLEYGSNQPIIPDGETTEVQPDKGTAPYESTIKSADMKPKEINGWKCVTDSVDDMEIVIESSLDKAANNIRTFYYTKVETKADLTIRKSGSDSIDENQSFVFHVRGTDANTNQVDLKVSVIGNGYVTIKDLPTGDYTIQEETAWSWRYIPDSTVYNISLIQDYVHTVSNSRSISRWLNGMNQKANHWTIK